ncbi:hypothetical protein L1887_39181 [Cichorium endivia]|nr:hypothetical protein L1887_39181 [Cichorium endivia]
MSGKDSLPSETYAYGIYRPIGTHSRIGNEYQTEIPPLITNPEYLDYIKNPIDEEMKPEVHKKKYTRSTHTELDLKFHHQFRENYVVWGWSMMNGCVSIPHLMAILILKTPIVFVLFGTNS